MLPQPDGKRKTSRKPVSGAGPGGPVSSSASFGASASPAFRDPVTRDWEPGGGGGAREHSEAGPPRPERDVFRSVPVGVIGGEGVQVPHLAEAALDVRDVDLHVVLEAADIRSIYCPLNVI